MPNHTFLILFGIGFAILLFFALKLIGIMLR